MKKYRIVVAHDKGIISFKVTAMSKERATVIVMKSENCPSHAILSCKELKG